jgi:phage terminase large subunit GpA-like protein
MVHQFKLPLYLIGTDTAKDVIYSRLRLVSAGPGAMHFPAWIDTEYVDQLTSEKAVTRYVKNKGAVRSYEVMENRRNEAIDLEVYALATLYILGAEVVKELETLAARLSKPPEDEQPRVQPLRRPSWADRF